MGMLLLNGSSDLNPRELFANNEQGLWLDPSQMSTMYQDSNGVTPCTAAGDPVGLILDQSRGGLANLGSEIVTNGGLSDATGWTVSGASPPSITGGQAVWSASTGEIQWASSLTVGKWYKLEFDLVSYTSGNLAFRDGTTNTSIATAGAVAGRKTFLINATSTQIRFISFASATVTIDNISVREVPGNHAYQTTSASRPTLARIPSSGRRNLLTYSEQFDVTTGGWQKTNTSIAPNTETAPNGTMTADTLTGSGAGSLSRVVYQNITRAIPATFSLYAKKGSNNFIQLLTDQVNNGFVNFDLNTGTLSATTATGSITSVGDGWYRCEMSINAGSTFGNIYIGLVTSNSAVRYEANTLTSNVSIWGAQLELGSTATNYQKVVATTDVTESGVSDLWHLVFDGSDDSLTTNSVDMTGTAQMTVIAGVRRNGTGTGMILEHTADLNSNNGAFYIYTDSIERTLFASRGTTPQSKHSGTITTPYTVVKTLATDISAPSITGRVNGAVVATDANTQGTGNYANAALYIGRRGGSSLPYNGHIYQLIIRGRTTPTGKLLEAERFVARRTGVTGI